MSKGSDKKLTSGAKAASKGAIEVAAGLAFPGIGDSLAKLVLGLSAVVSDAALRDKKARHDRFVRALLDGGVRPGDDFTAPALEEIHFASVYQAVLLDEEVEKADLGARLLMSFQSGECAPSIRPILVRWLRELPMGAIRLLVQLEAALRAAEAVPVPPREKGKPPEEKQSIVLRAYRKAVHSFFYRVASARTESGIAALAYTNQALLLDQGLLLHEYLGKTQPVPGGFPRPTPLGRLFLRSVGIAISAAGTWRTTADLTPHDTEVGAVEVLLVDGEQSQQFIGSIRWPRGRPDPEACTLRFAKAGETESRLLTDFQEFRYIAPSLANL